MSFDLKEFASGCMVGNPEEFVKRCETLRLFLEETNKHVNLTRITEKEEFELKHVADSLLIIRFFPEIATGRFHVADLGCGAGFPSLILALAFPELQICAIDSTLKKLRFVESAAQMLGLSNLRTVHGRIEELNRQQEFRNHFDFVVARAVAESPKLAKAASAFPRKGGGRFVFYKTPGQAAEELPVLKERWHMTPEVELPGCGARVMVFSEKY
ncbi:MAG: 16S rRNA (guanine(527)-N(7))-methyltransferase RsmG [Lentisphaeria bacterium]|nr:16S rRNA (guanine(527)-N(7))-methyltransferase RsmG [Lentisphaeria bacterium]